jgi:1-deoxy-D-xylulose-5-phosphate reductoisomerase
MRSICVLGSTGSVGVQSLDVARSLGLKVSGLSAYSNVELLVEQARQFSPTMVAIGDVRAQARAEAAFSELSPAPELLVGPEGLVQLAASRKHDIVVNAIVGFAGVWSTLAAIDAGHDVALANKETLVAAGSIVMERARRAGVSIRPVDSEHSAIFQCIRGQDRDAISRIILTASGGPFRDRRRSEEARRGDGTLRRRDRQEELRQGCPWCCSSRSTAACGLERRSSLWPQLWGMRTFNLRRPGRPGRRP